MNEKNELSKPTETVDRATDHVKEPEWWLADGIPGTGPRPDYLESKYKSLEEQAKSYREVRRALGAQAGAPDEYVFGELEQELDIKSPVIQDYVTYAKENRISQEAFSKTLKTFVEYEKSKLPNLDEEIKKLGEDGPRKIDTVQKWAQNNLSEKAQKVIGELGTKAEVIEMLDELRQYQHHKSIVLPTSEDAAAAFKPLTKAEVTEEMIQNYSKYKTDARYRSEIQAKLEQAVG